MYSTNLKLNFFQADPAGIMFFANIFNLAHMAYEKMLEDGCLERDYFNDDEYAIPIIHTSADFLKPVFPGDQLITEILVSNLRDSSFELTYNFKNKNDEMLATVKTVHVMISRYSWDKTKMPIDLSEYLLQYLDKGME